MTLSEHSPGSTRGPDILSRAEEKHAARALSPAVAWPTLAMAVALPVAHWTIVGLGLARVLPLWACLATLTFTAYAHYTLVHEAIHGNLVPGHPRLRWLNPLVGWLGALALGYNWPSLLRTHVLHHAHTNSEKDPDAQLKGSLAALVLKWWVGVVCVATIPPILLKRISPGLYQKLAGNLVGSEVWQASGVAAATLALLAAAVATGRTLDWLCLLFIPTRLASLILNIFFSWLPHHPFDQTQRYRNTRISLWPGGGVLLLQQNLHLIHHLWPGVPFYNYGHLYRRLRPTLIAEGAPIQGLLVGRHARDLSRQVASLPNI